MPRPHAPQTLQPRERPKPRFPRPTVRPRPSPTTANGAQLNGCARLAGIPWPAPARSASSAPCSAPASPFGSPRRGRRARSRTVAPRRRSLGHERGRHHDPARWVRMPIPLRGDRGGRAAERRSRRLSVAAITRSHRVARISADGRLPLAAPARRRFVTRSLRCSASLVALRLLSDKRTDPEHGIEPLDDRVGKTFCQVEFHAQLRMLRHRQVCSGNDVALAERRKAGNPKSARDCAVERRDFGEGVRELIKQWLRALKEALPPRR